jgi:hypothetical protein
VAKHLKNMGIVTIATYIISGDQLTLEHVLSRLWAGQLEEIRMHDSHALGIKKMDMYS